MDGKQLLMVRSRKRQFFNGWKNVGMACVFSLFAGCMVGPKYVKPTVPVSSDYKEREGWKLAEPRDHALGAEWWKLFKDPRLDALEQEIDISNQNIAQAEGQFRQARALVQAARASYFPTITLGSSYTRQFKSLQPTGPLLPSPHANDDYTLNGNASWELDLWGRIRRNVESSRESAQASAADLESMRLSIRAELAQDYFQLRALDALKNFYDQTIVALQKFLDMTQNRYRSGVASQADVYQAETQLETLLAQALDVGIQRAQLEHAIAALLGKPPSEFDLPALPLTETPPPVPAGVASELLERRPDVAAAERRVAAANAQIGVAEAAYFPAVTLSSTGGYENANLARWIIWPSRFWSLGPSVSETVFDGGLRHAQVNQAKAVYDQNVASYRLTVLTAFQEVEDNLAALRILEREAQAQNEAVNAAQRALVFTTNQYKAGISSALDVVTTETIAFNDQRTAITILGNRMTASVQLVKALGGGWDVSSLPKAKNVMYTQEKLPGCPSNPPSFFKRLGSFLWSIL